MLSNLAESLLDKERVTTTVAKAKEVRGVVERLITYGKKGSLHAIRLAAKRIKNKTILKKLFEDIAPGYKEREGGYTRVVKLKNRKGDNAELAIIELAGRHGDVKRKRKKKKKAPPARKTKVQTKDTKEVSEESAQEAVKEKKETAKKKTTKTAETKKKAAGAKKKATGDKEGKKKETKGNKEPKTKKSKTKEPTVKKTSDTEKKKEEE